MECVEFEEKNIPVVQFQWLLDIASYLQFVTVGGGINCRFTERRISCGQGAEDKGRTHSHLGV